jgi:hypothetical protein
MGTSMQTDSRIRRNSSIPAWAAFTASCLWGTSILLAQEGKPETEGAPKPESTKSDETAKSDESAKTEPDYRNWFDVSVGGNMVRGNKAQFMENHQMPAGAYGGVSNFHYEQDVGKKGLFEIDGRGIFDNHDYSLTLNVQHPDYGYLRGGYREFRTWYNGTGGYLPVNDGMFHLENAELAIDRGEFWFEGGLTLPDKPILTFRYSHQFREGDKDSTIWGDTKSNLPDARGIVPTFLDIDEKRDIFQIDAEHTLSNTRFGAGLIFESSKEDDSRNILRNPGEAGQRYVTQEEKVDTDLFNVHAFQETWFKDNLLFTSGYSFTTMDTDIGGSRIYGMDYDSIYDPTYPGRQNRDEGFLNLTGGSRVDQHVANLNLMLTPWENFTITTSLRIENDEQSGNADYTETNVGSDLVSSQAAINNTRERGFTDVSEGFEARYTGVTNWVLYARTEWLEGDGTLAEREAEADTGLVFRDTDSGRFTQKYAAGANWYPVRNLNFAGQYYYKSLKNDYNHTLDSTSNLPTSGDRYPAFIRSQNFTTHDVNFRATIRPLPNLTLVSRYDFQLSTVNSYMDYLTPMESGNITTHIFGESLSWSPMSRLFLQGSLNYVIDRGETPAVDLFPAYIQRSDNDYVDANVTVGFALTGKTDLQAQYFLYYANNYADNSAVSVPYNTSAEQHGITGTLIHRFSKAMQWTIKYGWTSYTDKLYGGMNDYEAHMIESSFRYRF